MFEENMGATGPQKPDEEIEGGELKNKEGEINAEKSVEEPSKIDSLEKKRGGLRRKIDKIKEQRAELKKEKKEEREVKEGEKILNKEEKKRKRKEAKKEIDELLNRGKSEHHDITDLAKKYGFEEYVIKKFSSTVKNLIEIKNRNMSNMSEADKSLKRMQEEAKRQRNKSFGLPSDYESIKYSTRTEEDKWIRKLKSDIWTLEDSLKDRSKEEKKDINRLSLLEKIKF